MPGSGSAGQDELVVDFHAHYYPQRYLDAIQAPDSGLVTYRREDGRLVARWCGGVTLTVVNPMPDARARIAMMDELGMQKQVISIPAPSVYFLKGKEAATLAERVNDELAEFPRTDATRFDAMAMLPMTDPKLALEELDRVLGTLGMTGVMLLTHVAGTALDDPFFEEFWAEANRRSLLVHVHPTAPPDAGLAGDYALTIAIGFMHETTLALSRLIFSGIFERYPDIRWVFSHLGGTLPFVLPRLDGYYRQFPECQEHISRPPSEYATEVFYDTVSTHEPALRCAHETFGADHLVFGSDYPHVPGGAAPFLRAVESLPLTPAEHVEVIGARAQRLLDGKRE